MIDIEQALRRVPDYQRFMTVDEMFERARAVAKDHPSVAEYHIVGRSTDGEEIPMVRIGDGPRSLLLFACPHPNEPIGAMLVQFLLDELIENEELRRGRSWYLLPCVDPDGTRLNEAWFSGPFTIRNYARNFYRPRSQEQVEWTFPIQYKEFSFDRPLPETKALMQAFELARPDFVYSLHNAGFGGVYYYISHDIEKAYPEFHRLPRERDLFLSLGEPEMPWAQEFAPAVYKIPSVRDSYDYYEKYSERHPNELIQGGASSFDYLGERGGPVALITELPYFQSPQVSDQSATDRTRRDVILEGIERARQMFETIRSILADIEAEMTLDTRFYRAVGSFTRSILDSLDSKRNWALEADGMDEPATVAQETDELLIGNFYRLLVASMLRRAIDAQLEECKSDRLEQSREELDRHLEGWTREIEDNLEYSPIPIRKLVEVQYGAMLAVLNNLGSGGRVR